MEAPSNLYLTSTTVEDDSLIKDSPFPKRRVFVDQDNTIISIHNRMKRIVMNGCLCMNEIYLLLVHAFWVRSACRMYGSEYLVIPRSHQQKCNNIESQINASLTDQQITFYHILYMTSFCSFCKSIQALPSICLPTPFTICHCLYIDVTISLPS